MKKEYKLKCFGCGEQFFNKEDVYRKEGRPYCGECMAGFEPYYDEDPRSEQEIIDEANIARYGEC